MPLTIRAALEQAISLLARHSPSAHADAEILLGHTLGKPRHWPYIWGDKTLRTREQEQFQYRIIQRISGLPVAYLTGHRAFWSLDLSVTPDTLIPRPETEGLVETALGIIPKQAKWCIADLGTGAGPIALAIARERPNCQIIATDISTSALAVAKQNAKRHKIENVIFRHGDWFAALAPHVINTSLEKSSKETRHEQTFCEGYQIIVSNPPYVATEDPHLSHGDVRFEPRLALLGGPEGLDAIRQIAHGARKQLHPGSWLILEHGFDQREQIRTHLRELHYGEITTRRDYGGQERITLAKRGDS